MGERFNFQTFQFMKLTSFPVLALLLVCLLRPIQAEPSSFEATSKPNFIIIFTDDQGYQDLGVFGSPNIKTPHIDRMAKEGRVFTSFYVASPVCSASRAALMTGCYPARVGITKPVFFPTDKWGLHPEETTIADMLKSAGYATACVGKWHLGHHKEFLPTRQGFDSYFGIPYSNDMSHPDNRKPGRMSFEEAWKNQAQGIKTWNPPLMKNEEIVEMPADQRTITRRYTDHAIEFVSQHKDKPFFLYLAHAMPHVPLFVPEEVHDPEHAYKSVIEHLDAETGRLLDALREQGLDKNTYVIFTSDNGPWRTQGVFGGSALPLSGGKGWFQEGGVRVPCVMWGPGRIPAGTKTDEMAATIDILPTFAALAGITPKTRGPIDGLDLSGLITGKTPSPRTEFLFCGGLGGQKGSKDFKNVLYGMRQGDWKILGRDLDKSPALFNLADDISEKSDLAKKNPEKVVALRDRAKELWKEVEGNVRSLGYLK